MPLNLIRNPYSKLTAILLLICVARTAGAQEISPCSISGPTTVAYGSSGTYFLSGNCAAGTTLATSCGQITGSASGSITVNFNNSSCTAATISTPNGAAQSFQVIITSTLGGGYITNQFQNPINYNSAPQLLSGTAATGGSCGGAYQYYWFSSPDETNWTLISGATGQSYQPGPLTAMTYFKREVVCSLDGSSDNNTAYTNWALVDVCSPVTTGTITPSIQYISYGQTPLTQLSTSGAGGGCSTSYSYQWQSSPDNSTWTNVNGATGSTYAPPALTATTYYRLAVTSNGAVAYSGSSEVYVYQVTGIAITPYTKYINYDSLPGTLTLSGYTGNLSNYTFQWQSSTSSTFSSPTNVGTNSTTYTPGNLTATTYYRVQVTNNGVVGFSDTATVTVYPSLFSGNVTPRITRCEYNTPPPTFSLVGTSGGNGVYTYQWDTTSNLSNWSPVTHGGNGPTLSIGPITTITYFRCVVTSNGVSYSSNAPLCAVNPPLFPGTLSPASQSVASGTPVALVDSGTTNGVGTRLWQWQSALDTTKPATWLMVTGQQSDTVYTPPSNPGPTYYRVLITATYTYTGYTTSISAKTNWVLVSVDLPLGGGTISGPSGTIPYNTSPGTLGSTQDATGGLCYPGDFRYQWQFSIDGINFYSVIGATANTYTPAPLNASIYFRRQVSCSGHTFNSNTIYIQVAAGTQQNCTVSN